VDRDVGSDGGFRSAPAGAPTRDHWFAIVVGIDRYPCFRDLAGACNDAEAFAEWLVDPAGGDVPVGNVRVLLGREATDVRTARPIKRDVDIALHELVGHVRSSGAASRLYLYFAGHGVAAGLGTGAVLMADAEPGLCWNLSLGPYRGWLERCRDFAEVVLVSDCCRSIAVDVPEGMPPHETCSQPGRGPYRAFIALAADLGERAYEKRDSRGQFTTLLLDGLRGRAADATTGEVRADMLAAFLESQLERRAEPPQRADTSIIGEPLTLATVAPVRFDVTINLRDGPVRTVQVLGHGGAVVGSETRASGAWIIRLGNGLYELADPTAPAVLFKVDGAGRRVEG
jgi:hypothetical protein